MNSIPDATPAVESVRGKQKTATLALAHMLDHDLPTANWHVCPRVPSLRGQIRIGVDDDATRAALDQWAEFLGAEITEEEHTDAAGTLTELRITTVYRDATLQVWGVVNRKPAEDEAAGR